MEVVEPSGFNLNVVVCAGMVTVVSAVHPPNTLPLSPPASANASEYSVSSPSAGSAKSTVCSAMQPLNAAPSMADTVRGTVTLVMVVLPAKAPMPMEVTPSAKVTPVPVPRYAESTRSVLCPFV